MKESISKTNLLSKSELYDPIAGYVSGQSANPERLTRTIRIVAEIIAPYIEKNEINNLLVAGCGDGLEARVLQEVFDASVLGLDIGLDETSLTGNAKLVYRQADLAQIDESDDHFDLIYSYHVLEHVPDPAQVLIELRRVLNAEGLLFIGFPNRHRVVGYLGSHTAVDFRQKISWNIQDYKMRLRGKFKNEYGAHAGFTQREFLTLAKNIFSDVTPIRNEYFVRKYQRPGRLIDFIRVSGLGEVLYPSNYFICRK